MAKKNLKKFVYLEKWDTRYGLQERAVTRDENGKFIDSVNLTGLRKSPLVVTR